jgi:hypothetical protein
MRQREERDERKQVTRLARLARLNEAEKEPIKVLAADVVSLKLARHFVRGSPFLKVTKSPLPSHYTSKLLNFLSKFPHNSSNHS